MAPYTILISLVLAAAAVASASCNSEGAWIRIAQSPGASPQTHDTPNFFFDPRGHRWYPVQMENQADGPVQHSPELGPDVGEPVHMVPCHLQYREPRYKSVSSPILESRQEIPIDIITNPKTGVAGTWVERDFQGH